MTMSNTKSELKKVIKLIVMSKFNSQYGVDRNIDDYDVRSIPRTETHKFAYEIFSLNPDDFFKIHIYCTITDRTEVGDFRLEINTPRHLNYGGEVYVTEMEIDTSFLCIDHNEVRQSPDFIDNDDTLLNVLLCENGIDAIVAGDDEDYLWLN